MTQMGGTGIWCRIYPQGACNYIKLYLLGFIYQDSKPNNIPSAWCKLQRANVIIASWQNKLYWLLLDFFLSRDIKSHDFFFFLFSPLPICLQMRNLILLMCVHMHIFTCVSNPFKISELLFFAGKVCPWIQACRCGSAGSVLWRPLSCCP